MKLSPTPTHPHAAALMAVLWLIAILSLACLSTLRVITFDLELATAKIHGSRARQVAEMGIAIGTHPAIKRTDPLLHHTDGKTGESYDVKITSEAARFNINYLLINHARDKEFLTSLFIRWGLKLEEAQEVTDALIDWVDPGDEEQLNGAEKKFYEKEGRINQPFNRPFYDLNEMRLVRGMLKIEAIKPDWRDWFTLWSGGPLDINEASAELIAAAADVSIERADSIPEAVRGPDGIRDTQDDVPFTGDNAAQAYTLLGLDANDPATSRFTFQDETTRIESTGTAEGAKRKISVILKNRTGKPALIERTEEIIP